MLKANPLVPAQQRKATDKALCPLVPAKAGTQRDMLRLLWRERQIVAPNKRSEIREACMSENCRIALHTALAIYTTFG